MQYEKGVLKPLESVEFREVEELLVKIVDVEKRREFSADTGECYTLVPKELLDSFILEVEEQ